MFEIARTGDGHPSDPDTLGVYLPVAGPPGDDKLPDPIGRHLGFVLRFPPLAPDDLIPKILLSRGDCHAKETIYRGKSKKAEIRARSGDPIEAAVILSIHREPAFCAAMQPPRS